MRSSDFTPVAARYDETRHIPEPVLARCYARLTERGLLPRRARILDVGCGTGQISSPLARLGHSVLGLDLSQAMLRIAAEKRGADWDALHAVGDACAIPARDGAFDVTVHSKLLMHLVDWRKACAELVRVTRRGGTVVQVSDRGSFNSFVRRAFSSRADALGYRDRFPGPLPASGAVVAEMERLGCAACPVDAADLRWERQVSPRDVLDGFRARLFAEFWTLPPEVYAAILEDVATAAGDQAGGLDAPEILRPFLAVDAFRVPA